MAGGQYLPAHYYNSDPSLPRPPALAILSTSYVPLNPPTHAGSKISNLPHQQHRNTPENNLSTPFKFSTQNQTIISEILKRYPPQSKKAAVMPLLDLG